MAAIDPGGLPVSLAEVQAFLRIETGDEEALLAGLVRSAAALCEEFTGLTLMTRAVRERISAGPAWSRLTHTPIRSIDAVARVALGGAEEPLALGDYAVDIDSAGDGWVRLCAGLPATLMVDAVAGRAAQSDELPEALRQGIVRMSAHLFNNRDGDGGEPPAAVTALWRPYRRMRLA